MYHEGMINQTMLDYVTAERLRGVVDADIRSALLTQGWKVEDVERVLAPESASSLGSRVAPAYSSAYVSSLFHGRIGRWHYLFSSIILCLVSFAVGILVLGVIIMLAIAQQGLAEGIIALGVVVGIILAVVLGIPLLLWSLGLSVRRLHDLGHSGWWILLNFIPYVSIGLTIYLFFFRGQDAANRFGSIETYPRSFHGAWDALLRK